MRRILIDHARPPAQKRGGEFEKVQLDEGLVFPLKQSAELLAVDEALERLAKLDERQARIQQKRSRATNALLRAINEGDCTHTIRINRRAAVRGSANTYARGQ
jgi:hypothetical protein